MVTVEVEVTATAEVTTNIMTASAIAQNTRTTTMQETPKPFSNPFFDPLVWYLADAAMWAPDYSLNHIYGSGHEITSGFGYSTAKGDGVGNGVVYGYYRNYIITRRATHF